MIATPLCRAWIRAALCVAAAAGAAGAWLTASTGLSLECEGRAAIQDLEPVRTFSARVDEYARLHRRHEAAVPPVTVSNDIGTVRSSVQALARRIRETRRGARQGEFFTPDLAAILRRQIAGCLTPEDVEALLAERDPDHPPPPGRLTVNISWPEDVGLSFVPPLLITVFPPLPPELQYRVLERTLILWDAHADLIVDVLPDAFTS